MHRLLPLFGLLILLGCGPQATTETAEPKPRSHPFPIAIDEQTVYAEIAITAREQRRGLMHREALEADHGMLFPYVSPRRMRFWMANTLIHLDIGFFDAEGILREVHSMYAGDTQTTESRRSNLQFALEMEQGWFRENGIQPGAQMNLQDLANAVRQRGFEPGRYGL